jgi:hypothetical protein
VTVTAAGREVRQAVGSGAGVSSSSLHVKVIAPAEDALGREHRPVLHLGCVEDEGGGALGTAEAEQGAVAREPVAGARRPREADDVGQWHDAHLRLRPERALHPADDDAVLEVEDRARVVLAAVDLDAADEQDARPVAGPQLLCEIPAHHLEDVDGHLVDEVPRAGQPDPPVGGVDDQLLAVHGRP